VSLVLGAGAVDWADGLPLDADAFSGRQVDLRPVFSRAWCADHGIDAGRRDSVVNKVPLTARTASLMGVVEPSVYLHEMEKRDELRSSALNARLATHAVDAWALRADDFDAFFAARHRALVRLVEEATGRPMTDAGRSADTGRRRGRAHQQASASQPT
jgi:hypothetical protein